LTFQSHVTSSSRDHLIPRRPFPIGGLLEPSLYKLYLTVSEIVNVECHAMVDMTLIRPLNKLVKIIHFGTNRFIIYDFLQAVDSNFCSRTQRLATIRYGETDGRNTVA